MKHVVFASFLLAIVFGSLFFGVNNGSQVVPSIGKPNSESLQKASYNFQSIINPEASSDEVQQSQYNSHW